MVVRPPMDSSCAVKLTEVKTNVPFEGALI